MYAGNSTKDLVLTVDKINVLNYQSGNDTIKAKITLSAHKLGVSSEEYLSRGPSSLSLYVYMVTETQSKKIVSGLSEQYRKKTLSKIELFGYENIKAQQDNQTKFPISELLSSKKIDKSNVETGRNYSCSFEIEIQKKIEQLDNLEEICLYAFFETSENITAPTPSTNIVYEKILKVDSLGEYYLPETRMGYMVAESASGLRQGQPYSGKVHYDKKTAAFRAIDSSGRPTARLEQVEFSSDKIYSQQDLESFAEIKVSLPSLGLLTEQPAGQGLESLSSEYSTYNSVDTLSRRINIIRNSAFVGLRQESTFITKETAQTAYFRVYRKPNMNIASTSYCGSVIGIDLYQMLKSRSNLGPIIDFHYRKKNYAVISKILQATRVEEFKILRKRVSSLEEKFNASGSKIRGEYEVPTPEETVIVTTQPEGGQILHMVNPLAEVQQVNIINPETGAPSPGILSVSLKDYDLMHNHDFGTYTYNIELTVEDGAIKYIKNLHDRLHSSLEKYKKYSQDFYASLDTNDYTSSAKTSLIDQCIRVLAEVKSFLSGDTIDTSSVAKQMKPGMIDEKAVNIFLQAMEKAMSALREQAKSFISLSQNNNSQNLKSVGSSLAPGFIYCKEKTNIFHELDGLLSVSADPIPDTLENKEILEYEELVPSLIGLDGTDRYLPSRFVEIEKSGYFVDNQEEKAVSAHRADGSSANNVLKHKGVRKENLPAGQLSTLVTKSEYDTFSQNQKRLTNIKMGSIKAAGNMAPSIKGKPDGFFEKYLESSVSGMSLTASKYSYNTFPASMEQALKDAIMDVAPDASEVLKESIVKSAYKAKDRKDFESNIANNYKELISIKESLGSAYQQFSSFLAFQESYYIDSNKIDYERLYKEDNNMDTAQSQVLSTPFESESYQVEIIVPGFGIVPLDTSSPPRGPGIIFLKMKNNKLKKLPLINNGIMLRVS